MAVVALVPAMALGQVAPPEAAAGDVPRLPFPTINNGRLAELAAQLVIVHNVPGVAVAVVDKSGVRAIGSAGVRASGNAKRVEPEDPFHVGSCGKAFTSLLIARLAEQGRLSLTTPVSAYLKDTKIDPAFAEVTLLDLLRHRSGLDGRDDTEQLPFLRAGAADPTASRAALAARMLGVPPVEGHRRGMFSYSNSGYAIAGHIAERVTGKSFEVLMREEVFAPLDITTAGFGAPGEFGKVVAPLGHSQASGPIPPGPFADNPAGFSPAGTMHLSLRDWGRITAVYLGGGPEGFLKPESIKQLTAAPDGAAGTDTDPRYAAGWGLTSTRGRPTLTHAGSNTMWFAQVLLLPEEGGGGWGVIVATNAAPPAGQKACTDAVKELVALSTSPMR